MRPNQVTIEQCMSGWADKEKVFFPADKHHAARLTVEDWRAQSLTYGYGRPPGHMLRHAHWADTGSSSTCMTVGRPACGGSMRSGVRP